MVRFFKKAAPKLGLVLSDGSSLKFEAIDHEVGAMRTEDPRIIGEVLQAISQHRGGIDEINEAEFVELHKKKDSSLPPRWREEWRLPQIRHPRLTLQSPAPCVEVAADNPEPAAAALPPSL